MKVISFLQTKGGVGKTTCVINVAQALAMSGVDVAVVDTDPQASLQNWNKANLAQFTIYAAESEKDVYRVRKELQHHDYVIIDGAATLSVITHSALMVSDLVIVPVTPSPLDFSASSSVLDVIEAQNMNRATPITCRFLLTRYVDGTVMGDLLKSSIDSVGQQRFKTRMAHRQSYIRSLLDGGTIFDTRDSAARGEVSMLVEEIKQLII